MHVRTTQMRRIVSPCCAREVSGAHPTAMIPHLMLRLEFEIPALSREDLGCLFLQFGRSTRVHRFAKDTFYTLCGFALMVVTCEVVR
jgi:hypothetical protein